MDKVTWVTHDEQHIPMAGSAVLSGFQKHKLQVGFILGFFFGGCGGGILNIHTEGISTTTEKPKPEINTFCPKPGKAQTGK